MLPADPSGRVAGGLEQSGSKRDSHTNTEPGLQTFCIHFFFSPFACPRIEPKILLGSSTVRGDGLCSVLWREFHSPGENTRRTGLRINPRSTRVRAGRRIEFASAKVTKSTFVD